MFEIEYETKINFLNNKINLDVKCWQCNAHPRTESNEMVRDENGNCEYCGGTGFIPTDNGREILRFIKRHKDKI